VTEYDFGTLTGDLGCFPLDYEAYPSQSDSRDSYTGIRSLVQRGTVGTAPVRFSLSTPSA
jgi:hypothetical protein